MKRTLMRVCGDRWCRAEIELTGEGDDARLSICGTEGRIITRAQAKRDALSYWESFFDDSPAEIIEMGKRNGKRFSTAKGAARYVLECDGEFHGLDIDGPDDGKTVRIVENWGQIGESLKDYFPEIAPYLAWHLNDMRAECSHQESRGETWTTHPMAVCPDCGYKLGSAWLKRTLPVDVVAWARGETKASV